MYLALYRKYRPRRFCDVIGQEHIIKILSNQVKFNHVSHAYLFRGTRGTGKTSVAKIFAMKLNCERDDQEPCLMCNNCKEINNIIEIDAASNNGVDHIRNILEEIKYPPVNTKYKIYIIDEVHMLSQGAFNALLKTLEEPPSYIIFILATTDFKKIPVTILSRCQQFNFKKINSHDMSLALNNYMQQEKINISQQAIEYITYLSDGAMRDALSILDQCIAFYINQEIDLQKIIKLTGKINIIICHEFIFYLSTCKIKNILDLISQIISDGKDISQFISDLIIFLRDLIILETNSDQTDSLLKFNFISKTELEKIKLNLSGKISLLKHLVSMQSEIKYAINPRITLELFCMRACNLQDINKTQKQNLNHEENIIKHWPEFIKQFDGILKQILNLSCIKLLDLNTICIITQDMSSQIILAQKQLELEKKLREYFKLNTNIKLKLISRSV